MEGQTNYAVQEAVVTLVECVLEVIAGSVGEVMSYVVQETVVIPAWCVSMVFVIPVAN